MIAVGSLSLLAVGQAVTWAVLALRGRSQSAKHEATDTATLKELARANEQIAAALEKLNERGREHELADERRFTALEEFRHSQHETNQRLTGLAENFSRQILNVALGIAPAPAVVAPANRAPVRARR
jgi:hypothetical protein